MDYKPEYKDSFIPIERKGRRRLTRGGVCKCEEGGNKNTVIATDSKGFGRIFNTAAWDFERVE